jgi:hypothetical protein
MSLQALANSGLKLVTGAISATTAKTIQALSIFTPDKLQSMTNESRLKLSKIYVQCKTPPYNQVLDSDAIIKQILCEIKRNEDNKNINLLPPKLIEDLSAIINAYSNDADKYISMKKSVYDNEQTAAAQAIYNYALTNATLNSGVDAVKEAIPDFKSAITPPPTSPTPINVAETAIIASAVSLANVKTGMVLLKKLKDQIDEKYIPDFNSLITMLASLQKENELAIAVGDQEKIEDTNIKIKAVNSLLMQFCDSIDVIEQDAEYLQINGLSKNFNEILKNYNLEKYDKAKFDALQAKVDQIIIAKQTKQNELTERAKKAATTVKNFAEKGATNVSNFAEKTATNVSKFAEKGAEKLGSVFGNLNLFDGNKENVRQPNGRRGGKRSRHNRKRKTQKQNKKTHKRRR